MKKLLLIAASLGISFLTLTGCGQASYPENWFGVQQTRVESPLLITVQVKYNSSQTAYFRVNCEKTTQRDPIGFVSTTGSQSFTFDSQDLHCNQQVEGRFEGSETWQLLNTVSE